MPPNSKSLAARLREKGKRGFQEPNETDPIYAALPYLEETLQKHHDLPVNWINIQEILVGSGQ